MKKLGIAAILMLLLSLAAYGESHLGIWVWYLPDTSYSTPDKFADYMVGKSIKRVYIKVNDELGNSWFTPYLSKTTTDSFKKRNLEVWAWGYNYPSAFKNGSGNTVYTSIENQAKYVYTAAKNGYQGYVLDAETEFNQKPSDLLLLCKRAYEYKQQAIREGYASSSFKIYIAPMGNPKDHVYLSNNIININQYVDGYMPQTYLEVWGSSYMSYPETWVAQGTKDFKALGATKPIHHILSDEYGKITSDQINKAFKVSGNESSLWRFPNAGDAASGTIIGTINYINWKMFDTSIISNATMTVNIPSTITVGQYAQFTGSVSSNITSIKASVDGYQLSIGNGSVPVVNGNYSFKYIFTSAGNGRVLKVSGMNSSGVVIKEEQRSLNIYNSTSADIINIDKITYTTLPITVNTNETIKIDVSENKAASINRNYYVEVYAVRNGIEYLIGSSNFSLSAGITAKSIDIALNKFNTPGEFYTLVKIFSSNGGTLKTQRKGLYPDNVEGAVSGIPYYNQRANYDGRADVSCNVTSIGMLLDYYGITKPGINTGSWKRTADYLLNRFGTTGDPGTIDYIFNVVAGEKSSSKRMRTEYASTTALRNYLNAGKVVIAQVWFTGSGHVIVVSGYDGSYYKVHDPYGVFGGGYRYNAWYSAKNSTAVGNDTISVPGKNCKLARSVFEGGAIDAGDGKILIHIVD